jgi:hypothetical protein
MVSEKECLSRGWWINNDILWILVYKYIICQFMAGMTDDYCILYFS